MFKSLSLALVSFTVFRILKPLPIHSGIMNSIIQASRGVCCSVS